MKENKRKCFKCGRSPANNKKVKLFRFPRPGITNSLRYESWAKYCLPEKTCTAEFQKWLYSEHYMLCEQHFKPTSFVHLEKKTFYRFAVPEDVKRVVLQDPNKSDSSVAHQSNCSPISTKGEEMKSPLGDKNFIYIKEAASSETCKITAHETLEAPVSIATTSALPPVPDKQKYYMRKCRKHMQKICQLRNKIKNQTNNQLSKALEDDESLTYLSQKITPTMALILPGEIKNFKRKEKGRRWTKDQKISALRIFKRSPTCYNLLRRFIILPSPSALKKLLQQFHINVGINKKIFEMLKKFSNSQDPKENEYVLTFDEMAIKKHLLYNNKGDKIDGHQDHGQQGRSSQVASHVATHALVFMICGIRKKLKQPVAYYLSGSSVTADRLAVLIKEVLYYCFEANINMSNTVCDMDGVNKRALGILGATAANPEFEIYNHKIVSLIDPPHLLKCFRNLFMKYNIKHSTNITSEGNIGEGELPTEAVVTGNS